MVYVIGVYDNGLRMKILTRYIFKEMLVPTTLGFIFYTFLILTRQLFDIAASRCPTSSS